MMVPTLNWPLAIALALAAVGSAVLTGAALAVYLRRRARSYLLVALAVAVLLARTGVAVATIIGLIPRDIHHFLEHSLDVVMAGLVIAAVYYARSVTSAASEGES